MLSKNLQFKIWRKVKLGEIVNITMGQLPHSEFYNTQGRGLPFYQGVTDFGEKYPKKSMYCSQAKKIAERDNIFFSVRAPVGSVNIATEKSCIGRGVAALQMKNGNNSFLYFLLKNYERYFKSVAGGTTYESINKDQIENIKILVPENSDDQKRIASILSAFDDKIELNNKISAALEQMAQTIFKEWFVKDKKSKKLKIERIGNIAKVVLGGTPSRLKKEYWDGDIPWINSGKANEFRIISASENITSEGLIKSNTQLMPKRATIIAITGATLGQVSLLEIDACANQSVIGIFGSELLSPEFIYLFIKEEILEIIQQAAGGAQQHINKGIIENYPIFIPSLEVNSKFSKIVKPIFDEISKNVFENQKLAVLRDLLLPKLMSGEVEV